MFNLSLTMASLPSYDDAYAQRFGWCYLCLFLPRYRDVVSSAIGRLPTRSVVEAYYENHPEQIDRSSFFSVSFGTQASVDCSQKLLAHVSLATSRTSLLRFRDVFSLMPPFSFFGADVGSSDPSPTVAVPVPSFVGKLSDPLVRRFKVRLGGVSYDDDQFRTSDVTLSSNSIISAYTSFSGYAEFLDVKITFIPEYTPVTVVTSFNVCWCPSNETAPAGLPKFQASPSHDVFSLGPTASGGLPAPREFSFSPGYNVQAVFNPAPQIGGSPTLAWRKGCLPLYKATELDPKTVVVTVYLEAVVALAPGYPPRFATL